MTMTCPDCGHQLQIAKSKSGQRAKCLECSKVFRISPKRTARPPKALANDSSPESSEDEPSFDFAGLAELESQCPSIPQSEPSEFSPQRGPRRGPRRKGGDPAEQKAPKRRAQSTWFRDSVGIVLSVLDAVREFLSTLVLDSPMLVRIGGPLLGLALLAFWLNAYSTKLTGDPEGALRDARQLAAQIAKLKPGMRQPDVEKLLGPPHEIAVIWLAAGVAPETQPQSIKKLSLPAQVLDLGGYWDWHCWNPAAFTAEPQDAPQNMRDRTITVDFTQPVAEWSGQSRVYVAVTSKRLDPEVLHFIRPESRPGEVVGDWQRRNEKFQKSLRVGVDERGFYVFLTYDQEHKLVDVTAWCAEFPKAMNVRRPPDWNPASLGTEILRSAMLVPREKEAKVIDKPQEVPN